MAWWDVKWWRLFIVLPLAEKFGLETTLNMSVRDAFAYRDTLSEKNLIDEYYYWFSDYKREKNKDGKSKSESKKYMSSLLDSEKDKRKVSKAMESSSNYLAFLNERGFNGGKTNIKPSKKR